MVGWWCKAVGLKCDWVCIFTVMFGKCTAAKFRAGIRKIFTTNFCKYIFHWLDYCKASDASKRWNWTAVLSEWIQFQHAKMGVLQYTDKSTDIRALFLFFSTMKRNLRGSWNTTKRSSSNSKNRHWVLLETTQEVTLTSGKRSASTVAVTGWVYMRKYVLPIKLFWIRIIDFKFPRLIDMS